MDNRQTGLVEREVHAIERQALALERMAAAMENLFILLTPIEDNEDGND